MVEHRSLETGSKGIKGTIANIDISQLLQIVRVSNTTLMIRAISEEKEGVFYLKDGHVLHASTYQKSGEEAFFEIALWDNVIFEIIPYSESDVPQTIFKPWEYLALESARIRDEAIRQKRIHVLIVEDSTFFAKNLKRLIEDDPEFIVVGIANNGSEAIEYLESEAVDVVTLDAFMPVMPGDTTLKHLMIRYGVPVVVVSGFIEGSTDTLFEFLRLGAIEVFPKPKNRRDNQEEYGRMLRSVLKKASKAKMERFRVWKPTISKPTFDINKESPDNNRILVIVGLEGSHTDWFRLPLDDFLAAGYVIGLSGMDKEFMPALSELISRYKGYKTKLFLEESNEDTLLQTGTVNILHAYSLYSFEKLEKGYNISTPSQKIKKLELKDALEENLLKIANIRPDLLGILCLSGSEAFSDEWLETMLEYPVRWMFPPEEFLVFPQMADSVLRKAEYFRARGRHVEIFRGTYENIGNFWRNLRIGEI